MLTGEESLLLQMSETLGAYSSPYPVTSKVHCFTALFPLKHIMGTGCPFPIMTELFILKCPRREPCRQL